MQGVTQAEWKQAHGAALLLGQRGADLEEQMGNSACVLVMDYIPGRALLSEREPFQAPHLLRTAEDLGRCTASPLSCLGWITPPPRQELGELPQESSHCPWHDVHCLSHRLCRRGCLTCTHQRCCGQTADSNPPEQPERFFQQ